MDVPAGRRGCWRSALTLYPAEKRGLWIRPDGWRWRRGGGALLRRREGGRRKQLGQAQGGVVGMEGGRRKEKRARILSELPGDANTNKHSRTALGAEVRGSCYMGGGNGEVGRQRVIQCGKTRKKEGKKRRKHTKYVQPQWGSLVSSDFHSQNSNFQAKKLENWISEYKMNTLLAF